MWAIKGSGFNKMKIKKNIKIDKSNIEEISSLECVESFELLHDGTVFVRLKKEFTQGRQTLINGDYLCQFASGMWQRFGAEALNRTFMDPRKEAGNQW